MRAQAKRSSVANRVGSPLRGFAVGNRDDRTRGHFLCAKGSGTLVLHRGGGLAISLLAAALAVLVLAPNAAAFLTREKTASIGSDGTSATSFGDPNKLAFNLANGKLYVLDGVGAKIHAFDVPALTPLGGAFPLTVAQTGGDPGLAVDNTALASANNIYYLSEPNGLYGFDSTGASLSGFPVARSNFGDPCGAATDSAGGIWISDFAVQKIRKYDATGSPTGTVDTSTLGGPCPVAVASNGDLFFALFQGATWKYTVASGYSPASAIEIDPAATRALAVDTAADVLYVVHSDRVDAYNASTGAPLYDFAGGIASAAFRGVAVDQGTNEVYVSDTGNGKVHVFGPPASFPDATATAIAASNISYFSADVEGTVDDNDTSPTNWRLEVSADGFATVILAAAGRTDGGQTGVGVSGTASGLSLNTNYEFRVVTNKTSSPANDVASAPVSFKTLNHPNATATPTAVTNVTEESAEIGATITDNGPLPTNWRLELSSDGGQTWTMEGSGATSGGQTDVAVSTTASDLAPNTSYRFRVVTNKGPGSPDIVSSSTEFKTSSVPPVVTDVGAIQVTDTSARLVGTIDPRNSATAYAFEYGTTPALDSSTAPVAIGGGTAPITVSQVVSGLSPDTTYYFKLVATNEYGTTASSSKTLHTRAVPLPISHPGNCANEAIRQAQGSTFLPDCRAYEMVSPPDKNQGATDQVAAFPFVHAAISRDGNGAAFCTTSLFGEPTAQAGSFCSPYLSRRTGAGPTGWRTSYAAPRHCRYTFDGFVFENPPVVYFNAYLDRLAIKISESHDCAVEPIDPAAPDEVSNVYRQDLRADPTAFDLLNSGSSEGTQLAGLEQGVRGNDDFSQIVLTAKSSQTPDAPAGDFHKLYLWEEEGFHGCVQPGGCLSLLSKDTTGVPFATDSSMVVTDFAHPAFSADGERIYFYNGDGAAQHLYLREDGAVTLDVSASECTSSCGPDLSAEEFVSATPNGKAALFASCDQLTDESAPSQPCAEAPGFFTSGGTKLYRWERDAPPGSRLTDLTLDHEPGDGEQSDLVGVVGTSEDTEVVYFVTAGQIVPGEPTSPPLKLYRSRWNGGAPVVDYLGPYAVRGWAEGGGEGGVKTTSMSRDPNKLHPHNVELPRIGVTPDGEHLMLVSILRLDPAGDRDEDNDIYRWSEAEGWLCVSCQLPGEPSAGGVNTLRVRDNRHDFNVAEPMWLISEDGQRIFFEARDALLPGDVNGETGCPLVKATNTAGSIYACQDVYEWNDGALSLLTPGTGDSGFAIVGPTRTGESVFFTTGERLVGWDGDAARDIYVARVGGGFAEPAPAPAGCEGEGCRGAGSGTSQASGAGTAVFEGPGDAAPQRKCKKGSVKRRGQCVKKQRRRHRRAANNHRRAAR